MDLRDALAHLKEAGASAAKATWHPDGALASLDVSFQPVMSAAPFVDRDGKPIDLGEDLPELAFDPIHRANAKGQQ